MILKTPDFQREVKFNQANRNRFDGIRNIEGTESRKKSRKTVVILFLGTIGLSSLLWVQQKFKNWWQNSFPPITFQIVKTPQDSLGEVLGFKPDLRNLEGLKNSINLLTTDLQGTYGIYFFSLAEKTSLGINEDQVYTAASVIKVPIIINFYQQVEKGKLAEEEEYILKAADIQDFGTGQMRYQKPGTKYSYQELVELAGKKSDNTASYVLENLLGKEKIEQNLEKLGMKNTSMEENTTTPKEMGDYFAKLYEDKLVAAKSKEKIFSALTETDFEDRIAEGLPKNIKIAHKIGNEIQTYNDCGIVFASKPYVLCILSKGVAEDEALAVIPKISRLFWEFVNQ